MDKGDSVVNIRTPSQVGFNEMNRANLPAASTSLKLPLIIVALALILTLVLGLSIGLSNRNKNKKHTRVVIVKNNSTNSTNPTNPAGVNLIKKLMTLFLNSIQQKELIFCLEQKI